MGSGSVAAAVLSLLATVAAAAVCFMFPLTASPGPESAQVLAVVGGVALALLQAGKAAGRKPDGFVAEVAGGLLLGTGMLGIFVLVTMIGGAIHPSCSPSRGYLPFLFLAAPVLSLHIVLGTWIGRLVGTAGRAALLMLALEVGFALWLFLGWYHEPGFRIASHVFVVIAGDLFAGASMPPTVIAFRAATFLFSVSLFFLGAARYPRIRRVGIGGARISSPLLYALALAALVGGGVAHVMSIDSLMPDRADMERSYSLVKQRGLLVVHADPLAVHPKQVDAMLAEGTLWLERIALRLGTGPVEPIHVWLHATRDAQAHWTGAAHVDFALPWRRELHIVGAQVPHGTFGHELAHVVAGELSDTALKIPSDFVLLQHAAVVEGVAVFLTQELSIRSGLTVKEQAAAMRRAKLAPETVRLFDGLRFFAESPARAYVTAGAFIESLVARSLPEPTTVLAALYRTGSLADALRETPGMVLWEDGGTSALTPAQAAQELARLHDEMLDALALPEDAATVAAAQFTRPSILQEVCEPKDAERARSLRARVRTGDISSVLAELDAADLSEQAGATLIDLLADATDVEDSEALTRIGERLEALTKVNDLARRTVDHGDALWLAGALSADGAGGGRRAAMAAWDRALVQTLPVDAQRELLAKRVLAESIVRSGERAPVASAALDVLLATSPHKQASAFERLHYWIGVDDGVNDGARAAARREPRSGVAMGRYLHARRLVRTGALEDGAQQLRRTLFEAILPPVFLEQAILVAATALAKSGQAEVASELLSQAADHAERPALRLIMRDRYQRATRAAAAAKRPMHITGESDPAWADQLLLGIDADGEL